MSSKKLATRQNLLQTALRLLEEGDGKGVRMSDIAKSADVSRQTLYLHFGSRAELLIAVTRYADELHDVATRYAVVEATTTANDHLDALIQFWGHHVSAIYYVAQALWADRDPDGAAAAAWEDRMEAIRSGCQAAVTAIEKENLLDPMWDLETGTDCLFSLLSIRTWVILTRDCGWSIGEYIERQQAIARRTLCRP